MNRPQTWVELGQAAFVRTPGIIALSFLLLLSLSPAVAEETPSDPSARPVSLNSKPSTLRKSAARSRVQDLRVGTSSADLSEERARNAYRLNEDGVELVFKGKREEGIKKISKALELDPGNTTALYNLAGLELANSRPQEAIALMEKAVELSPNDLAFWNRLAESHFANNGIEKAIVYYEKIISIDPSYGEVMVRLGTLYGMTKNWEKAETTLKRAVEAHAKDVRALGNLGNVLVLRQKFPEAIEVLSQAQEIESTSGSAVGLAIAHEALGKRQEALAFYEKAKELGDKDPNLDKHIEELRRSLQTSNK